MMNRQNNLSIINHEQRVQKLTKTKEFFFHSGLIVLAAVLFAASFPNIITKNGFSFAAWFAYIPILIVIRKYNIFLCAIWGIIYGIAAYSLFNYWLGAFHPAAGLIAYSVYAVYLALVFMLFKLADIFFEKRAFLVQWLIWLSYEYLRTQGFLGYAYGITGYSQWQFLHLIQIAGITGVWGVSALVTFPSFWLFGAFNKEFLPRTTLTNTNNENIFYNRFVRFVWFAVKNNKIPAVIWLIMLAATLIYGFININNYSSEIKAGSYRTAQIALVQHNSDPWAASRAHLHWQKIEAYRNDLTILKRLSDEALASNPKPQMVVWPETAFIPRIYWHTTYRDDQESWSIVKELLEYLSDKDAPFLIGNDDARMDLNRNRIDYNAAMLFENGINTAVYRKIHLVPFTEHFPYKKTFPKIYQWLINSDTHFWEKGTEETIFQGPGFKFSSPICFEDTFGYLSRNFTLKGAELFINMSNDAWADSLVSQKQHLGMSVFRSVENSRPAVRSTVSGQTAFIDPAGRIISEAAPFTETWINASVPIINQQKTTIYTKYGDFLGIFFCFTAGLLLIFGAVWYIIGKRKIRK